MSKHLVFGHTLWVKCVKSTKKIHNASKLCCCQSATHLVKAGGYRWKPNLQCNMPAHVSVNHNVSKQLGHVCLPYWQDVSDCKPPSISLWRSSAAAHLCGVATNLQMAILPNGDRSLIATAGFGRRCPGPIRKWVHSHAIRNKRRHQNLSDSCLSLPLWTLSSLCFSRLLLL